MWWTLAGLGAGMAKHLVDSKNRNKFIEGESQRAKWAPWTGHKAKVPDQNNWLATALQGGVTGASFGQQFAAPKVAEPAWGQWDVGETATVDPWILQAQGVPGAGVYA